MDRTAAFIIFFISVNWYEIKCLSQKQEGYCFAKDDQTHVFFNKYTPYEFVYCKNPIGELPDGSACPLHGTVFIKLTQL